MRNRSWLIYVPPLAFFSIVTGIFTNLTSEDLSNPLLWAGLVVSALISTALTVWIGRMTSPEDPVKAAATALRRVLHARWKRDPAWRSVGEGGRLPVRWKPGPADLFPANPAVWPAPAEGDNGARLAALFTARERHSCLVVLGEAGGGKTELLLSVFRTLLARPSEDDPVPILIPMTAWHRGATADEWLFEWLHDNFPFLRGVVAGGTLSQALAEKRKLLLLLDGFDEITAEDREQALHDLNQIAGEWPMLLTSRGAEYRAVQSAGRAFENASGIELQAQEPDDALKYLQGRSAPDRWSAVQEALPDSAVLKQALNRPLTVMLANTIYNRAANEVAGPPPAPSNLLSYSDSTALVDHLQSEFLPVRYLPNPNPPRWTVDQARRGLGYFAHALGPDTEFRWWDLPTKPTPSTKPGKPATPGTDWAQIGLTALAILMWTSLSAGLLNQWIFNEANTGITDAIRISAAALLSYFALGYLTGQQDTALLAATGAYIAGALSGTYDLAVVVGLVVGFSWRFTRHPKAGPVRRGTLRDAVGVGLASAAVALAIRGAGLLLPLTPSLIEGFGGGALDGLASRWDQDAHGWLATGVVTASVAWAGVVIARGRDSSLAGPATHPVRHGAIAFLAVALFNCWADRYGKVEHAWMEAPADGLAVGLAVWCVSYWSRLRSAPGQPRGANRAVPYGLLAGVVTVALNLPAYWTRTDMHTEWTRALADGIGTGLLVWLALDLPHRPRAARPPDLAGPRQRVRLALPAVGAGVMIGVLDTTSAGVGRGGATGITTGLVIYFLTLRRREPQVATGPSGISPVEVGVAVLILVGLVAGFGYALMYGIIAGLGCRVARDIAVRRQPAGRRPEISSRGVATGVLLGSVALLGAVFNHLPTGALIVIGLTSFVAGAFAFGVQSKDPDRLPAASPFILYKRDRNASILIITVVAVAIGVAVGARSATVTDSARAGVLAAAGTMLTYGLTAGLVVATAATRFPVFTVARVRLWYRGETPWALMRFLNDAHEKRLVLRSTGAIYQFRHQQLQKQIAADYARRWPSDTGP